MFLATFYGGRISIYLKKKPKGEGDPGVFGCPEVTLRWFKASAEGKHETG